MIDPVSRAALRRSGGTLRAPVPLGARRPRVSVVIPCYNYGRYLAACVASALDHEGLDLEVIIVDDASQDDSADIAARIADGEPRVSLVRHATNQRHLATYNDGFAAATGEYLVQLSADDLLPRNSLTRAVALLEALPSVGLVYGKTVPFSGPPPEPVSADVEAWVQWAGADWIAARCRAGFNVIATTEVVWRRALLDEVGAYRLDLPHSGDLELWLRMATACDIGFVVGPVQGLYRLHDANMHVDQFSGGSSEGQLIDLRERWLAFEALFEADPGTSRDWAVLRGRVRQTLAAQALRTAAYAYARGFAGFPVAEFEELARQINPGALETSAGRSLRRRRRLGFLPLPLHPLWAADAVRHRARGSIDAWRRERIGL